MTPCNETTSEGLYAKYEVRKGDKPVEDCFVLRPDRDSAARVALLAYAYATDDLRLRSDLHRWVQRIQDEVAPSEMEATRLAVYESAVAHATHRADLARREAESCDFMLKDAQRVLADSRAALPGTEAPS